MEVRVTNCRSCRAEIVWVRTPKGKNMPLDATPVPGGDWSIKEGEDKPEAYKARGNDDQVRYQSHFKSCPNADQHSKSDQPSHPQRGAPGATDAAARMVQLTEELEEANRRLNIARGALRAWASAGGPLEECRACAAFQHALDVAKGPRATNA